MFPSKIVSAGAVCALVVATSAGKAQTPAASPSVSVAAQAGSGAGGGQAATGATRVHGTVADPDGAVIPGATVLFTSPKGTTRKATSGADGSYSVMIAPGTYNLLVTMQGFSSYSVQSLKIAPVASLTIDAKLQIGQQEVVVNVDANAVQLSVDPDSNASATVIQGKDLEALSDDPDELQSELSALAGPAAGPNGGQIYVDGFTGGQLPPKSSIREIRVNQNPFSAEYDRIGYGRVEVFTKPGTDTYHGNFQTNGNPSQFNSPNPLSGAYEPPYHTIFMFGSLTGPVNKNISFSIGGSHRDIEDNQFTNASLYTTAQGSTTPCAPGVVTGCGTYQTQIFTHYPQLRTDISPRFDFALGAKNVLTARFQFVQNDATNAGMGNLTLPDSGYNSDSKNEEIQLSDTQTWSSRLINETRFEWERDRISYAPLNTAPAISVQGSFTYGGNSTYQNTSDHQDHFEVQNYTSVALKKNFIRFGGRLRTTREAQFAAGNTNGSFIYTDLPSYQANTPSQFTLTVLNSKDVHYTYADLGIYAEDDWKPRNNLTVSYGLRYETQNHLPDHHDFAPRLSFAYGLGSSKGAPKTVVRGGFGIFYDRFGNNYILNLARFNGVNETLFTETTVPTGCTPQAFTAAKTNGTLNPCTTGSTASGGSVYSTSNGTFAPTLRSPYLVEFAGGMDQQAGRHGTVSVNYIHSQGVHQLAMQNVDCPVAGGQCSGSVVNNQYFSEGSFKQDQLMFNGRMQTSRWVSLFGYYALNFAKGDSSGAATPVSVPYDIKADYGRTLFDTRQRLFLAGSVTLPKFIQFSPYVQAQSGSPYNVTLGTDPLNSGYFNERPVAVPVGMANGGTIRAIQSCGVAFADPANAPGYSTAPINPCTGPNLFTFNFRLTKAFGFGEKTGGNSAGSGGGGSHGGPGGGGHGSHGGPGGGFGGFGGTSTGRRYSFALGLNVQNLFNNRDLATPVSVLSSPNFGQSITLQGGPYTQQSAVRRLSLQASFNF